jgi:uncharacterized Zn ribbon protein
MARHAHEFSCTNCSWWNYPMLSDKMHGNYTIICGNCKHEHYRVIKGGVVTEDRHNSAMDHGDTIHVMKSASFKEKKPEQKKGMIVKLREMATAGLAR